LPSGNLKLPQANLLIFKAVLLGFRCRYSFRTRGSALPQTISIAVSILALAISVATAWLTLFRRGTVRMTQPTTIYFGADASASPSPKVYLRTLLYSTAKRGQIIESMFVRLRRGESIQTFNIWVYGEGSLARGSGLYVGENGVTCNHHFLLPADGTKFEFLPGEYKVEVYASLVGVKQPLLLYVTGLSVAEQTAKQLQDTDYGVYFDWGPDSGHYHAHVRKHPNPKSLPEFLEAVLRNPALQSKEADSQ
jgi:hypothetical protein